MRMRVRVAAVAFAPVFLISLACKAAPKYGNGPKAGKVPAAIAAQVTITQVAKKLAKPVGIYAAPGDATRLYIVEKVGRVRVMTVADGKIATAPVLDVVSKVSSENEQGLLGLAFHPKFADNRRFFIHYTNKSGDTRVAELKLPKATPDKADPAMKELFALEQPYSNHNGGHLAFGPDGMLYIGLGDGGAANDPHGNGQDPEALLGKMLRMDVDAATPKAVIHMKGLRNPWRYSFDSKTGDLYIGDVGQDAWEEIDVVAAAAAKSGGQNFGWNTVEGMKHCFAKRDCKQDGMTQPVIEYGHGAGCSVTGGVVYRGKALAAILDGAYFYADYCTGLIRSFRWKNGVVSDHWDWGPVINKGGRPMTSIAHFGVDLDGEMYFVSLDGGIWKLAKKSS